MKVNNFITALLETDRLAAREIARSNLNENDPFAVIESIIVPALEKIGEDWEKGTVALSQVYMSGRIVEEIVEEILPYSDPRRINQPRMAIAVLDDFHLLGKRIVYSLLRASGYSLLDFGRVTVDELLERINSESIKIILISTLMLPSALQIKKLTEKLKQSGNPVKIIVGGAPFRFDKLLAEEVGADATAADAKATLTLINSLMEVTE